MNGPVEKRLAKFARGIIQSGWEHCDVDGGDIQDRAETLGLIVKTKYDPAVHGGNDVGCEPGDDWFVLADDVKALAQ